MHVLSKNIPLKTLRTLLISLTVLRIFSWNIDRLECRMLLRTCCLRFLWMSLSWRRVAAAQTATARSPRRHRPAAAVAATVTTWCQHDVSSVWRHRRACAVVVCLAWRHTRSRRRLTCCAIMMRHRRQRRWRHRAVRDDCRSVHVSMTMVVVLSSPSTTSTSCRQGDRCAVCFIITRQVWRQTAALQRQPRFCALCHSMHDCVMNFETLCISSEW